MTSHPSKFPLTTSGPFRLYSTEELLRMPPPHWLVDTILPAGGLVALYGQPGEGKSFVALDLALSVASGKPWLSQFPVQAGYVVYISAEGGTGIGKRVQAWITARGVSPANLPIAWLIESIPIYADSEQMHVLLKRISTEIDVAPTLVVVDTLARCFDGDENQQEDMGRFIAGIDTIRHTFKATVLVVHHTRLDGERERGNTAFRGAADAMIGLSLDVAEHPEQGIILACKKQKDAEPFPELRCRLVPVSGTGSCVTHPEAEEILTQVTEVLKQAGKPLFLGELHKALHWVSMSRSTLVRCLRDSVETGEIIKENGKYRL